MFVLVIAALGLAAASTAATAREWETPVLAWLPVAVAGLAAAAVFYARDRRQRRRVGDDVLGPPDLPLRASAVLGITVAFVSLVVFREIVWDAGREPESTLESVLRWVSLAWLLPLFAAMMSLAGFLMYRRRRYDPQDMQPITTEVSFRIVSRGQNAEALASTVTNIREEMARLPLFPYRIEVVTDLDVTLPHGPDLRHFVVPANYETPQGSLYKARALEYALWHSDLGDHAWLMHLDEESHITPSLVRGIHAAVREEQARGTARIGQGAILYHRHLERHPFLTLADSLRTGDDYSRFYFQHRLGMTLFGLHGSFILTRNDVEKEVGFDLGPRGSITEDAFWALKQMHRGRRCRWVDGHVSEQSPESVKDFIKQRRRWFIGLILVVLYAKVPLRWRLPLAVSTMMWAFSWVGIGFTVVNLLLGLYIPTWVFLTASFIFSIYITLYVIGLKVNLQDHGPTRLPTPLLYVLQVVLIPVFSLMESAGVLYGIVKPDMSFHVVQKRRAGVAIAHGKPVEEPLPARAISVATAAAAPRPTMLVGAGVGHHLERRSSHDRRAEDRRRGHGAHRYMGPDRRATSGDRRRRPDRRGSAVGDSGRPLTVLPGGHEPVVGHERRRAGRVSSRTSA